MKNNTHAEIRLSNKTLVDSLLALNTNNRSIKSSVVDRYMRDIKAGKWVLTNQGIGVSDTNVLIDGQHRLEAIKKCGYPSVPLLIVYGLDESSQMVVDQQAKRTARDCLHFAFSVRVSRYAPAIGNLLYKVRGGQGAQPSINELMAIIEDCMEEIEFVSSIPRDSQFFAASYLAAFVAVLKDGGDKQKTKEFIRQVESGELLDKSMPAFHLRNVMIHGGKAKAGGAVQFERFRKASKALKAYLNGEKMGVLKV
jgi:hypothetical protein